MRVNQVLLKSFSKAGSAELKESKQNSFSPSQLKRPVSLPSENSKSQEIPWTQKNKHIDECLPSSCWSEADWQHQVAALGSCPLQMPYLTAKSWQELSSNMCFLWRATVSRWDRQTACFPEPVLLCGHLGRLPRGHGGPGTRHFLSAVLEAVQRQLCWMSLRNRWLRGSTQVEVWGQLEITWDLGTLTKVGLNPPALPFGSSSFNHLLRFFWLGHRWMGDVNLPLLFPPPTLSGLYRRPY